MQSNGVPSGHAIFCLDLDICFQLIFRKTLRLCLEELIQFEGSKDIFEHTLDKYFLYKI
jgi:hypothetical protein